jgi:hypothetical protein
LRVKGRQLAAEPGGAGGVLGGVAGRQSSFSSSQELSRGIAEVHQRRQARIQFIVHSVCHG